MQDLTEFTPFESLFGGILIGLAGILLLFFSGRIAGISGIFGGFLQFKSEDTLWRFTFISGLICGGLTLLLMLPQTLTFELDRSAFSVIGAGLLVGIGTRMGNGCTSGHGVCGIGRLSARSIVATITFLILGICMATLIEIWFGGVI